MTVATLAEVLRMAVAGRRAVAGLVVLGWEDARAFVEAAESVGAPAVLQAGPSCRRHTPAPIMGKMFRWLAERASVPIVAHIDHAVTIEECRQGIDCGFTSVMIDGSALSLGENIALTRSVVDLARRSGVSVEGEVGVVGYKGGTGSLATDPGDASRFERETGVDALAVSVGNVHLSQTADSRIDDAAMLAITDQTTTPLVLHGGSGVPAVERLRLARDRRVAKFNVGTELRIAFGRALKAHVLASPDSYDRIEILKATEEPLRQAAAAVIDQLWRP